LKAAQDTDAKNPRSSKELPLALPSPLSGPQQGDHTLLDSFYFLMCANTPPRHQKVPDKNHKTQVVGYHKAVR
jgi:hypothetical protein